jgi:hypothetical protein
MYDNTLISNLILNKANLILYYRYH